MSTTSGGGQQGQTFKQLVLDNAPKALGALATTAGFLGFVAFTGSALTWLRFYTAQIPADQAIGHVSRSELLATGTATLVLFAVLGLLAVAVAYAIEPHGRPTILMAGALVLLLSVETSVAIVQAPNLTYDRRLFAAIAVAGCGAAIVVAAMVLANRVAGGLELDGAYAKPRHLERTETETRQRKAPPAAMALTGRGQLLVAVVTAASALLLWWWTDLYAMIAYVVAAVLCGIVFRVADATALMFWAYGLAVFFSVSLYGLLLDVDRLLFDPQASPVAIIRTGDEPGAGVEGLYVAKDADGIWFATVGTRCLNGDGTQIEHASGRLFRVPTSAVRDWAVGASQNAVIAAKQAPALLAELDATEQPRSGALPPGTVQRAVAPSPAPALVEADTCGKPTLRRVWPVAVAPGDRVVAVGQDLSQHDTLALGGTAIRTVSYVSPTEIVFQLPVSAHSGWLTVSPPGTHPPSASQSKQTHDPVSVSVEDRSVTPDATTSVTMKDRRTVTTVSTDALFAFDSTRLTWRGDALLARIGGRLLDRGARRIAVYGFTDAVGPAAYDRELSYRRAVRVRDVLLADGRPRPRRIVVLGLGGTRPIGDDGVPSGRARNRRVEIVVWR